MIKTKILGEGDWWVVGLLVSLGQIELALDLLRLNYQIWTEKSRTPGVLLKCIRFFFFNPTQFFVSCPVMWYQKYMKSRRKKSAEIRMAIGLVGIRVALIQLFPRRCAPQPFRAGSPRWFLYVLCMGLLGRMPPSPHAPARGSIVQKWEKRLLGRFFAVLQIH